MFAQTTFGEIKGKIIDSTSNEPIPFASVWVEANGNKVRSGERGGANKGDKKGEIR